MNAIPHKDQEIHTLLLAFVHWAAIGTRGTQAITQTRRPFRSFLDLTGLRDASRSHRSLFKFLKGPLGSKRAAHYLPQAISGLKQSAAAGCNGQKRPIAEDASPFSSFNRSHWGQRDL
jgi:hypothetical protein